MRKITKPKQKCNKCGSIFKSEEYEDFCDECEKKIDWNPKMGFSARLDFILHSEKGSKSVDFCSAKCMFKWLLKNGKRTLKHKDDFFGLDYWNKENIDELLNLIDKRKLKQ